MIVEEGLSSTEVCTRAGVTYRKLWYWRQLGLIRPSVAMAKGSGQHDRWAESDVAHVALVGRIMALTGSAEVAANALSLARSEDGAWLVCSDGDSIVVADGHLEEILRETGGGTVIVLNVTDVELCNDHVRRAAS